MIDKAANKEHFNLYYIIKEEVGRYQIPPPQDIWSGICKAVNESGKLKLNPE